jgi:DNA transformation protein and related proteins
MPKRHDDDGLTTHILDLLAPWSVVDARRMFGGIGLFAQGRMFAIIIDDVLYLKDSLDADGQPVKTDFEKEYFEYERQDKIVRLGYFQAPETALEDGRYLIDLAKASYQSATLKKTALKSKTPSRSPSKTSKTSKTSNTPKTSKAKVVTKPPVSYLKNPFL